LYSRDLGGARGGGKEPVQLVEWLGKLRAGEGGNQDLGWKASTEINYWSEILLPGDQNRRVRMKGGQDLEGGMLGQKET